MKGLDLGDIVRLAGLGAGLGGLAALLVPVLHTQIETRAAALRPPAEAHERLAATRAQTRDVFTLLDPPALATSAVGQTDASTLRLIGVAITANRRAALIGVPGEAPTWTVEGETAHGMTVTAVETNSVQLRAPAGGLTELHVFAESAMSPADPAPNAQ